jgi:toxin CptA
LDYRASRVLLAATIAVAALAMVAVAISGAPRWLRVALVLLVAVAGAASLVRLLRPRIGSLLWRTDGGVDLVLRRTRPDRRREAQGAIQQARVMGPLIVLAVRWPPHGGSTLWLLPDNLDPDTRRRLRMRIGSGRACAPASGNADSG